MNAVALICTINGKIKCSTNLVFAIPLIIYAYYISDFNQHPPYIDTVYNTVFWLLSGLLILLFYSETNGKIWFYYLIAFITIGFQLLKASHLLDSFKYYNPIVLNPLVSFSLIFISLYVLRRYYLKIIKKQEDQISATNQGVNKILQESTFSIAQLRAERDEAGNLVQLYVDKVNNTFESVFKINLYEVQDQKADYIFNLIFKNKFDLNKIITDQVKKNKRISCREYGTVV